MSVLKLCANHPICFNLQIDGKLGSLLEFFLFFFLVYEQINVSLTDIWPVLLLELVLF